MAKKRLELAILPLVLAGCDQGPEATPIRELMAEQVQPTADIYWGAVRFESELVDGEPVERDIKPQTDADWQKVADSAAKLGEYGELLQTEAYTEGRGEDWKQFAQSLVEVAKQAEQAAAEKSPEKVFEVGGTVYSVCKACHDVYPPAEGPGSTGAS